MSASEQRPRFSEDAVIPFAVREEAGRLIKLIKDPAHRREAYRWLNWRSRKTWEVERFIERMKLADDGR